MLVVEDEFIIALDLSETVKDLGYELEGPFPDKKRALASIRDGMPDCAILDIQTSDGEVYPLADELLEAGVPIIFHSGHVPPEEVRSRYPDAIACSKPCPPDQLIEVLQEAVAKAHVG
ncbi:MAG: response regulator [Porphyrobacter sp.]|nr:response regulator [Porphyrobacter sp.]